MRIILNKLLWKTRGNPMLIIYNIDVLCLSQLFLEYSHTFVPLLVSGGTAFMAGESRLIF